VPKKLIGIREMIESAEIAAMKREQNAAGLFTIWTELDMDCRYALCK
jgi:hypothetical protein